MFQNDVVALKTCGSQFVWVLSFEFCGEIADTSHPYNTNSRLQVFNL